ncbi:unnamed protein product [Phaeothamnion confervicola]
MLRLPQARLAQFRALRWRRAWDPMRSQALGEASLMCHALSTKPAATSVSSSDEILRAKMTLETGKVAGLADGAVIARHGDTVVLATVVADPSLVDATGFLPLTVEHREKAHASGKIPRTRDRRDVSQSEGEVLAGRVIDRVLRPLFAKGFCCETQVITTVQAWDGVSDPVVLSVNAAAAALAVSPLPWFGPVGCVRIGRLPNSVGGVDGSASSGAGVSGESGGVGVNGDDRGGGRFVVNPTQQELEESDLDLLYAANDRRTLMLEMAGDQIAEADVAQAMRLAQEALQPLLELQRQLVAAAGKHKNQSLLAAGPTPEMIAVARIAGFDAARTAFEGLEVASSCQCCSAWGIHCRTFPDRLLQCVRPSDLFVFVLG